MPSRATLIPALRASYRALKNFWMTWGSFGPVIPLSGALRASERHLGGFRHLAPLKSPIGAPARAERPLGRPAVEVVQVDGPSVAVLRGFELPGGNGPGDRGAALAGAFGGGIGGQSGHGPP